MRLVATIGGVKVYADHGVAPGCLEFRDQETGEILGTIVNLKEVVLGEPAFPEEGSDE